MSVLARGKQVLSTAEESLRLLVAQAATEGDYDVIVVMADWAKTLRRMLKGIELSETKSGDSLAAGEAPRQTKYRKNQPAKPASSPGRATKTQQEMKYPCFFRDADSLTKVGWSKSSRTEYDHKAPKEVVLRLVRTLERHGLRGRLFTMDALLPLVDAEGTEIPSYQAYLSLAWLRQIGLVRQHGRKGYSLAPGLELEQVAARAWEELPQRVKV